MQMKPHTHLFLVEAAPGAATACASWPFGIERTWNDVQALAGRYAS
jgi:hypothetical protein